MKKAILICVALTGILAYGAAEAVPTKLVVRAKARDAKFIGTSMGGAAVTVRDAETGKGLAEGLTAGATGDTQKIMIDPIERGKRITDRDTANFETFIDIDEPRLLTIEVEAPMGHKPNTIKNSTQIWLIPGKDIAGEGLVIEIPGFAVTADAPLEVKLADGKAVIPVNAAIVMVCGCKLSPEGMWDSSKYEIEALVKFNGKIINNVPLGFAGSPSAFAGEASVSEAGTYEIIVYAYDPVTGNTGIDRSVVTVD
jgi:hypothetical protein